MKRLAALLLLGAGVTVFGLGEPDSHRAAERLSSHLDSTLASRAVYIDPAELVSLMYDRRIDLRILDLRDEGDFNYFHLAGARRVPVGETGIRSIEALPATSVKVLVDPAECLSGDAWKRATALGTQNLYILSGGIEGWLDLYNTTTRGAFTTPQFHAALGERQAAAHPPQTWLKGREFERKVKAVTTAVTPTGGCGG